MINHAYQSLLSEARDMGDLVVDSKDYLVASFEVKQTQLAGQLLNRAQDLAVSGDIAGASQVMTDYRLILGFVSLDWPIS